MNDRRHKIKQAQKAEDEIEKIKEFLKALQMSYNYSLDKNYKTFVKIKTTKTFVGTFDFNRSVQIEIPLRINTELQVIREKWITRLEESANNYLNIKTTKS
jgi:hypothetical protein